MTNIDVAAYIWPSFHHEPRMAHVWTEGDGEWYTVRRATPRAQGHLQPHVPLLGYQDEADPQVMRQHVALAQHFGVNTFIMDWYWYDDQPCFERQLNEGLLPALEGTQQRVYLMWANHDATSAWDPSQGREERYWPGAVDAQTLDHVTARLIERYFKHPNYYRIDGAPVFSIYLLPTFIEGLGGLEQAAAALQRMRARCREAGLDGLHLQAIQMRGAPRDVMQRVPDIQGLSVTEMIQRLGFDSVTHYQYVHEAGSRGDYVAWADLATQRWSDLAQCYGRYYPHVSVGWDNTPRFPELDHFISGSTPAAFEAFLWKAKRFAARQASGQQLVTINSWNEWTESSYLLPDMRHGFGYLEAVRRVFGGSDALQLDQILALA